MQCIRNTLFYMAVVVSSIETALLVVLFAWMATAPACLDDPIKQAVYNMGAIFIKMLTFGFLAPWFVGNCSV